jgi:hypothetical protein
MLLFGLPSCIGLRLQLVERSVRKPGNVALYFTVDRANGDPVPGLITDNFRIYEDEKPISAHEAQRTILNKEVAAAHYTLLLMDMSGSVTESGQVPVLQAAAQAFTSRVEKFQRVAIYAFDGSPSLTAFVPFTGSAGSAARGVSALGSYKPRDPSTNLYGGVVEALKVLDQALARAPQPLRFGTLVVFTDGTDRAARASRDDMMRAVNERSYDVFVIGVGAEIDRSELSALGRSGTVLESKTTDAQIAFEKIAQRIEGYTKRFYLLSYCSPARAGEHELRIEAIAGDGARGSVIDRFDAVGFGPGCNPATPPAFDTTLRSRRAGASVGLPVRR